MKRPREQSLAWCSRATRAKERPSLWEGSNSGLGQANQTEPSRVGAWVLSWKCGQVPGGVKCADRSRVLRGDWLKAEGAELLAEEVEHSSQVFTQVLEVLGGAASLNMTFGVAEGLLVLLLLSCRLLTGLVGGGAGAATEPGAESDQGGEGANSGQSLPTTGSGCGGWARDQVGGLIEPGLEGVL